MTSINGVIVKVFSHNKDTGFSIVQAKPTDAASQAQLERAGGVGYITILGTYYDPGSKKNRYISCEGSFIESSKWGLQFKASSILLTRATKRFDFESFFRSDLFSAVSPEKKKKLLKKHGAQIFTSLLSADQEAVKCGDITAEEFERLAEEWHQNMRIWPNYNYLSNLGVSPNGAAHIAQALNKGALSSFTNDPYQMLSVPGVGFKSIDTAAEAMGMEMTSMARVSHGIKYILRNHMESGHTAFYLNDVSQRAAKAMGVEYDFIRDILLEKCEGGDLLAFGDELSPVLVGKQAHERDLAIAREFARLIKSPASITATCAYELDKRLNPGQIQAVRTCVQHKVAIITGGPGVGKTTVVRQTIGALQQQLPRPITVSLCAPSARAASRLGESSGLSADTIHALLDYHPQIGYRRNKDNPLQSDLVIVDEGSMVDVDCLHALLQAMPSHARLIIVGDRDQLSSVGAGATLRDLIESKTIAVAELTKIERRADGSSITVNAHRINKGQMPIIDKSQQNDFHFIRALGDEAVAAKISECITRLKDSGRCEFDDIQVLSPQIQTLCGVDAINKMMRALMNPARQGAAEFTSFGRSFRLHDRIMYVRNNKQLGINNGDLGKITAVDLQAKTASVSFEGTERILPFSAFGNMRHAFATTIHKAQGSECAVVILPIVQAHMRMLSVELIYTAITRAQKQCILIGDPQVLHSALSNNQSRQERVTLLREALEAALPLISAQQHPQIDRPLHRVNDGPGLCAP